MPRKNLKPEPASERLHDLLDEAIRRKGHKDWTGAVEVLTAAVADYPESGAAWGLMGGIYLYELEQFDKAIPCFQKATAISPTSERASLGLFHSFWDAGRQEEAIIEMMRFQAISRSEDYAEIVAELKEKGIIS